jgi:hypothetical protein
VSDAYLFALLCHGATPTEAIDAYYIRHVGLPPETVAEARDVGVKAVKRSAESAPELEGDWS